MAKFRLMQIHALIREVYTVSFYTERIYDCIEDAQLAQQNLATNGIQSIIVVW